MDTTTATDQATFTTIRIGTTTTSGIPIINSATFTIGALPRRFTSIPTCLATSKSIASHGVARFGITVGGKDTTGDGIQIPGTAIVGVMTLTMPSKT